MKTGNLPLPPFICCVVSALCACAGVPQADVEKQAAELKVYKVSDLSGIPYESVGHVWVDSWRTAFFPPTYPSEDEAMRSLRAEAARLGANGIVNVVCVDQNVPRKAASAEPAILCYANAIRIGGARDDRFQAIRDTPIS